MTPLVFLLPLVAVVGAASLSHLTPADRTTLKTQFRDALTETDVAILFHAVNGLKHLGETIDSATTKKLCDAAKSTETLANAYHGAALALALGSCSVDGAKASALIKAALTGSSTSAQDLFFAAGAAKHLKQTVDGAALAKSLTTAIAKDDTPAGLAYAFHTAATHLDAKQATPFFARIDDLVGQADEVDGKFLQFDGGLSVTALAVAGVYDLATKVGKSPAIKPDEVQKLSAYLLARRTPRLVRQADLVLSALKTLTTNKYHVPLSVQLASGVSLTSSSPSLTASVSNVLGESLGAMTVTVDSVVNDATKATVVSKAAMSKVAGESSNTHYEYKLLDGKTELVGGFYTLTISAASATEKRLLSTSGNKLRVKIVKNSIVAEASIYARDRDASKGAGNVHKLVVGSKLSKKMEADYHQKVGMKFKVVDKATKESVKVHQAFAIFTHKKTEREIIFIAEPDTEDRTFYKWETDLSKASKDFDGLSGDYSVRLVVGDAVMQEPIDWIVADISIKFSSLDGDQSKTKTDPMDMYKPKKDEKHTFAVPDARPPSFISDVFAIACAAPLAIALIGWLAVGPNFGLMPVSPYTLGFHAGLGGILYLFFTFWLRLNMFTTIKYLTVIGLATFLCGNRMLATMATQRKEKKGEQVEK